MHELSARARQVAQFLNLRGGTKLRAINPCASRSAIHVASFRSLFRPSALRMCITASRMSHSSVSSEVMYHAQDVSYAHACLHS